MNVPPPREIPRYRAQLAEYSERQRAHSAARRAEAIRRFRKLEKEIRMREVRRQRERELARQGQSSEIVIYRRPPITR